MFEKSHLKLNTLNVQPLQCWRPVLVVEEAGLPECTLFCNLQSPARTHTVLVIGLYELLGNPIFNDNN
jgi:hypothetical protein